MDLKIAPSVLAADFGRLTEELELVSPHVDLLHVDVMDGHYVPNLTFGMPVIEAMRAATDLYFDCHLMVTNPIALFEPLKEAGGNLVTVHVEVHPDLKIPAKAAREAGLDFGIVVNPSTPFEAIEPFVELADLILIMSVEPGFGGQAFIPEVLPKVEAARKIVEDTGIAADIQIDGGITPVTARQARDAGANVFVAGTAIFRAPDPVAAIADLRKAVD
ncbi:MAG: ribulose-phosphate 3-epimerase [Acidimicrobiia bacterium]|nr:ribulose-phosphate 3-epimerase [Acidimicrobiia bacterium]